MAEEKLGLHVDTDWKKQAQEEKRKLAEQEEKRKTAPPHRPESSREQLARPVQPPQRPVDPVPPDKRRTRVDRGSAKSPRQVLPHWSSLFSPRFSFTSATCPPAARTHDQPRHGQAQHRHPLDHRRKTRGNLSDEEKRLLDAALYEARMRYVALASRYAELP